MKLPYRGTAGAEVAVTLRNFSQTSLSLESPQIRILATSASIEDGKQGQQFVQRFLELIKYVFFYQR